MNYKHVQLYMYTYIALNLEDIIYQISDPPPLCPEPIFLMTSHLASFEGAGGRRPTRQGKRKKNKKKKKIKK